MSTTTVYRIEHPVDRCGPYTSVAASDLDLFRTMRDALNQHCWSDETGHPSPVQDGIGSIRYSEVCGFPDTEKLLQWFDRGPVLGLLDKCGFHVAEYEATAPDVRFGYHQLVFRKDSARKVAYQHISELRSK